MALMLVLFGTVGCNEEVQAPEPVIMESEFLNDLMFETLNIVSSDLGSIISVSNNNVYFDSRKTVETSLAFINVNFFNNHFSDFTLISEVLSKENPEGLSNKRLASFNYGLPEHYNQIQSSIISSFFNEIIIQESPEDVIHLADRFRSKIHKSGLNEEQAHEVLAFIEYASATATLFSNADFLERFQNMVVSASNGRILCCSINLKNVWRSAVVGGVAGTVAGAYVGCTAGTVALPGFGTVSGCVAGGVFGGAGGFVRGALGALVVELIFDE
jgi:hypothetical protein